MFKKIFTALLTVAAVSCTSDCPVEDSDVVTPPVPVKPDTEEKVPKQKGLWVGGAFDFTILNNKEYIDKYLKMCKATGFTFLYLDAMGPNGYALCNVDALAPYSEMNYDIFEYVLTKCEEYGMEVVASLTPLHVGDQKKKMGVFYDSDRWKGKTQCRKVNEGLTKPYRIVNIEDDLDADCIMLEPSIPDVKNYCVELCAQVVEKYKDYKAFRGLSLDYVRYSNAAPDGTWYGYGDEVVKNFTAMMNVRPDDQNDFISESGGFGKYFTEWVYFRSMTVAELVRAISKRCKEIDPDCEMHLWASAQWSSRYSVGQNWASSSYVPAVDRRYMEGYEKTGFAEALDVFSLGAYASDIYIKDNPSSEWTVENFVTTYQKYIPKNHKCKVWASVPSYAYSDNTKMRDAVLLCLHYTDGMSVFELGHVKNLNHWSAIKQGIDLSGY